MIQKYWRKVLLGFSLFLAFSFLFFSGFLARVDSVLYDNFLLQMNFGSTEEILIIKIDDKSLSALGRWPWSRNTHAKLLNILTDAQVKTVGFDILFAEADQSDRHADSLFAQAIARNGNVVLAVSPENYYNTQQVGEVLPLSLFAEHALALGHVELHLDSDGICRSIYLYAGQGSAHWPAFGFALGKNSRLQRTTIPDSLTINSSDEATQWRRNKKYLIPFVNSSESINSVSYIDVLNHQVTKQKLKDKIVLIGASASGLGDIIATPFGISHRLMSGVEINANVLAGLLNNIEIIKLPDWLYILLTLFVGAVFYWLLWVSGSKYAPVILFSGIIFVLLLSGVLLVTLHIWFAPVLLLLGLSLVYFFWNWFQLYTSTHTIQKLHHHIHYHSRYDKVTALPNKKLLQEFIQQAIHDNSTSGLLIINLGRFKTLKDRFGYKASDNVLNIVTARIKKAIRQVDKIARLDGGEFAVFMGKIEDDRALHNFGARILQSLRLTFALENREFYLHPSIGIAMYPNDGNDAEDLFNNALAAMHQAKRNNSRDVYFFSHTVKNDLHKQLDLEDDLHSALLHNQFEVYYQPQVDAKTSQVVGFEALLRWNHPDRGLVSPCEFIPLAEHTGDIVAIGYWVLETACQQANIWKNQGFSSIRMAVNLSPIQFSQEDFVEKITKIIRSSDFPAEQLELEITESMLIDDLDNAVYTIKKFNELGIKISVDDFGTGYSSLNYLKRFSMDRIKIDQSFINDLGTNSGSSEIILSIIDMAHRLNIKVIAEGVENSLQQEFLIDHKCEELQGFYFSKPLCVSGIDAILFSAGINAENPLDQSISLPRETK